MLLIVVVRTGASSVDFSVPPRRRALFRPCCGRQTIGRSEAREGRRRPAASDYRFGNAASLSNRKTFRFD
jgi:hypothetical protein